MRYVRLLPFLILICLCGCSTLSVSHLHRSPWIPGEQGQVDMTFFRFSYDMVPLNGKVGVRAVASLKEAAVPEWVNWVDRLGFTLYLTDKEGHVYASAPVSLLPRTRHDCSHIPFEQVLSTEDLQYGDIYVTFGYVLEGYESKVKEGGKGPFFARQDAVTR
jgi:hypothetical protein